MMDTDAIQALLDAAAAGDVETVSRLRQHATDPALVCQMLVFAASGGHTGVLAVLLTSDISRDLLELPLKIAARDGENAAVTMLLDAGADINADEGAALVAAAGDGQAHTVRLLLEAGADPGARGNDALYRATVMGHQEIIRILTAWKPR